MSATIPLNDNGEIDRLILNDVTGDLWTYGVLDDVKNLAMNYSDLKSLVTSIAAGDSSSGTTGATAVDRLSNLLVPTTSEILWGIVSAISSARPGRSSPATPAPC